MALLMPNPVTTKRLLTTGHPTGVPGSSPQASSAQTIVRAAISPEADQLVR